MVQQHTATVLNYQSTVQKHYFIRHCTSLSIPDHSQEQQAGQPLPLLKFSMNWGPCFWVKALQVTVSFVYTIF